MSFTQIVIILMASFNSKFNQNKCVHTKYVIVPKIGIDHQSFKNNLTQNTLFVVYFLSNKGLVV